MSSSSSDGRSGALMISAISIVAAVYQVSKEVLDIGIRSFKYPCWLGKSHDKTSRLAQLCSMLAALDPRYGSALMGQLTPFCEHDQHQWEAS